MNQMLAKSAVPVLFIENLESVSMLEGLGLVELYLDNFPIAADSEVKEKLKKYPFEKIITVRQPQFVETNLRFEEKIERIQYYYDVVDYFDFDIFQERALIDAFLAAFGGSKLITSFHAYEMCPTKEKISDLFSQMKSISSSVWKLAWVCKTSPELELMMSMLPECKASGRKFVLSPMGDLGKAGRMVLSACGVEWIYCSEGQHPTATGQLTFEEYQYYKSSLGCT